MTETIEDRDSITMSVRTAMFLFIGLVLAANVPAFVYMTVTTGTIRANAYRQCEERKVGRAAVNKGNTIFRDFMEDAADARQASAAIATDPRAARRDSATAEKYRNNAKQIPMLSGISCPRP